MFNIASLNDIPSGYYVAFKGRFYVYTPTALYKVTGNRLKLKRYWNRHKTPIRSNELSKLANQCIDNPNKSRRRQSSLKKP
jgi:hypothetical protein